MHDPNLNKNNRNSISTWKARTEAMAEFAHAMHKVAQSSVKQCPFRVQQSRLSKTYSRLAHAMEKAGYPLTHT